MTCSSRNILQLLRAFDMISAWATTGVDDGPMKPPEFCFSKEEVRQAGSALLSELLWSDDTVSNDHIRQVFSVVHAWRESHAFPMGRIRTHVLGQMRSLQLKGITAARLKRLPSIRKKLGKLSLDEIQDLGGCRAVLPTMSDVNKLIDRLRAASDHNILYESPYISEPKKSGYRSHHLIFEFVGREQEEFLNGRRIEVQVRTRHQHSWATAVEAVGLYRGEKFKSGQGNRDWLRLFELMASEMALIERCPELKKAPPRKERLEELKDLNARLDAVGTLDATSHVIFALDQHIYSREKPKYWLLEYDRSDALPTVSMSPYYGPVTGIQAYYERETVSLIKKNTNAVLVEVSKADDVMNAYPNYFGDVQLFKKTLDLIVSGREPKEYRLAPQQRVPPPPRQVADDSWFRQPRRRRWT